jgi:phenylacetate-CoA ligase
LKEEVLGSIAAICAYAAEHSHFYARSLRPVRSCEDFFALPMLNADDIRQHVNADGTGDLLTGPTRGSVVVSTSATSGARKIVHREFAEQHRIAEGLAMAMRLAGFTPDDRVANIFPPGGLLAAWIGMHEAVEILGATLLPVGATLPLDVEEQVRTLTWLRPTAIVGVPSMLVRLIEVGLPPVRSVLCGGEMIPPETREFMEKALGAEIALVYGNVECGTLGVQCEALRRTERYHILERDVFVEVVDRATGLPAEEGEILVTHLHRRLQPLIRYRAGDRGRRINSGCSCGLPLPVIELQGRVDELEVLVGDVRLRADDVAVAARGVPGLGERFQIRVRSSDGKEKIAIAFEGEGGLKDTVLEALLRGIPALRTLESSGALAVEVVKRGAIPTIAGKTPRIVDEREG